MFEILQAMSTPTMKIGRRVYHLYDCSGEEVITRQSRILSGRDYLTHIQALGNEWFALYSSPKAKL